MTQNSEQHYRKATVIGGGVIGASWTALFLARGLDVTVCDPAPGIAQRIRTELAAIAPNLEQLGLPDVSSSSMPLHFDPEITTAVAGSDIVQENGPERLEIKQQLWQAVESAASAHAILASSSSSIPASAMASGMKDPGRLIIGHPFNPPHLVPLVEIVGSSSTPADVVDRAVGFYRAMGKRPQVLAKEIPGFVANRLQAALFREAVYLVAQGVVSEQQLDDVVTSSIGMRWAVEDRSRASIWEADPAGSPISSATSAQRWRRCGRCWAPRPSTRQPWRLSRRRRPTSARRSRSSQHGATMLSSGCCGRSTK